MKIKKSIIIVFLMGLVTLATSAFIVKNTTGKAGFAGNPGSSDCSFCHFNGSGITTVSITGTPAFTNDQYVPGQTYTINITVSSTTLDHFGFDCVVLTGTTSTAVNAGTMTAIAGSSQILMSNLKSNAVQTIAEIGLGNPFSKTFMFEWTAPVSGTAAIYASGLAVNNNGTYGNGDLGSTTSLILSSSIDAGIKSIDEVSTTLSVFPNPSSESICLQYSLIIGGRVKGTLYNLQGSEVAMLFNDLQAPGVHAKTVLYPNDVKTGVYLLKLNVNGKQIGEKIIIKQ